MAAKLCPICARRQAATFAPFCSSRCKDTDLRRWLVGAFTSDPAVAALAAEYLAYSSALLFFSGLYFVYKDKGNSNRAVISLTIRVALSILVFVLLIGSYYFGWMTDGKL